MSDEYDEHRRVAEYLDQRWPYWFHPPNGGARNIIEAKRMQGLGVKRGVPDIIILCKFTMDGLPYSGIAIEMKRDSGGKPSVYQRWWLEVFKRLGWYSMVSHGADEAIEFLNKAIPLFIKVDPP